MEPETWDEIFARYDHDAQAEREYYAQMEREYHAQMEREYQAWLAGCAPLQGMTAPALYTLATLHIQTRLRYSIEAAEPHVNRCWCAFDGGQQCRTERRTRKPGRAFAAALLASSLLVAATG